jgi:hypothetical protein
VGRGGDARVDGDQDVDGRIHSPSTFIIDVLVINLNKICNCYKRTFLVCLASRETSYSYV